ncbi:MAG: FtsK/SpoIIIE domain-containing protein, partial [Candidatus Dormibacteraceae bacterium]
MLEGIRKAPAGAVIAVVAAAIWLLSLISGHPAQLFFSSSASDGVGAAINRIVGAGESGLHIAVVVVPLLLLAAVALWILIIRSIPYRASKLLKELPIRDRQGKGPRLRWAWKKGHVWHLAWKVPPLLLASGMEKGKEVFEQGLDANCNIWAKSGLVHMRAGTAKLPEFLSYEDFYHHSPPSGELVFGVGWSKEGALWQDLALAPHILSGGASGAGKTVFLRQAVTNLLLRYGPEQLKLVPIDLKRVEFNLFRDVPHLLPEIGVALKLEDCDAALSMLSDELFRRLARLEEAGVENIQNWNSSNPTEKLAYVLVVIDEVAEVQRSAEAAGSPRASKA